MNCDRRPQFGRKSDQNGAGRVRRGLGLPVRPLDAGSAGGLQARGFRMDERNFVYMFFGFAAVWAILAGYVLYIGSRERNLRRQLDRLRRMLEDREE